VGAKQLKDENEMATENNWVLLVGASGIVGRKTAERLRQRWPALSILAGGRDLQRAEALAAELGNARGVTLDLSRRDLGLAPDVSVVAVVMFVKDETLNGQLFAQDHGAAFIDISSAAFELGPQTAFYSERPEAAPVLLASNWLAGTSTFAALDLANGFDRIDRILVSALLDDQDIGGGAAEADYVRQTQAGPSGLVRKKGRFVWIAGEDAAGAFEAVDGRKFDAQAFGNLDVLSLSAATNASDVVFQFAVGETSSRRRGEKFSHEILIEISGISRDGQESHARRAVVHPDGQAPMTALGVSLAIEDMLGLRTGKKLAPGLYLPHVVVDPARAVGALREIGATIHDEWRGSNGVATYGAETLAQ
jgi:NAD(P)-dependent dehydrogenase (short-subunit alcohol dehydrogenase family)